MSTKLKRLRVAIVEIHLTQLTRTFVGVWDFTTLRTSFMQNLKYLWQIVSHVGPLKGVKVVILKMFRKKGPVGNLRKLKHHSGHYFYFLLSSVPFFSIPVLRVLRSESYLGTTYLFSYYSFPSRLLFSCYSLFLRPWIILICVWSKL